MSSDEFSSAAKELKDLLRDPDSVWWATYNTALHAYLLRKGENRSLDDIHLLCVAIADNAHTVAT